MEMESRTMKMLLQSMPKRGFVLTFTVFFVLLLICIIIGATGPHVYDVRSVSAYNCPPGVVEYNANICDGVDLAKNSTVWTGEIRNLDKLNQELLLIATLQNKLYATTGVEKDIHFTVGIAGRNSDQEDWKQVVAWGNFHTRNVRCREGRPSCSNETLAHEIFIRYSMYQYNVTIVNAESFLGDVYFTFAFVNHNYTLFELWFRFVFLLLTFIAVVIFAHKLRRFSWKEWMIEQQWAAVLLFGLMAYDNPFYPLEILVEGWFPIFLNRVFYASFIMLLLFFWLCVFDGLRMEPSQRKFLNFYFPKAVLLGFFWVSGITVYTWEQLHELDDPAYNSRADTPGFLAFQVIIIILLIVYVFWLCYAICRSVGDSKTLPYLGVRVKFFGIYTFVVILVVIGGLLFSGIGGGGYNNAAEFTSYLALFNLYVYTLAFMYLPSSDFTGATGTRGKVGMIRLEDDDTVQYEAAPTSPSTHEMNNL